MTRFIPAVSALCLLFAAAPGLAQSGTSDAKPVFLVTDVVVQDGIDIDRDAARDALATRFGRLKEKIEVRSMAEARAGVDAAALSQLLGEGDDDALAKVEQYVKVDRIVFGRIAKVGGVIDVQVKVFNVAESVTEVSFGRRLAAGSSPAMVLTLLDGVADSLLAWTINTYTDAKRSAAAERMAAKKLPPKVEAAPAPSSSSRFSWLGTVGGIGLGLGAGAAGAAGYGILNGGEVGDTEVALLVTGGVIGVLGAGAVVVDAVTE